MKVKTPFAAPPKNTRISPGIYADGKGGTTRSRNAPGPVKDHAAQVFRAIANGGLAGGVTYPGGAGGQPQQPTQTPQDIDPWFSKPMPREMLEQWQREHPDGRVQFSPDGGQSDPYAPASMPSQGQGFGPGKPLVTPQGVGRYAPGAMPANTRGDAMQVQPQGVPPRGTRLSPGVYADGRGGTYRSG